MEERKGVVFFMKHRVLTYLLTNRHD